MSISNTTVLEYKRRLYNAMRVVGTTHANVEAAMKQPQPFTDKLFAYFSAKDAVLEIVNEFIKDSNIGGAD